LTSLKIHSTISSVSMRVQLARKDRGNEEGSDRGSNEGFPDLKSQVKLSSRTV
jgi:hypothetical protein